MRAQPAPAWIIATLLLLVVVSMGQHTDSPDMRALLDWVKQKGGRLAPGLSIYPNGIRATASFNIRDDIMTIPMSLAISLNAITKSSVTEFLLAQGAEIASPDLIALNIAYEKASGKSKWKKYLDALPGVGETGIPVDFTPAQMDLIRGSFLRKLLEKGIDTTRETFHRLKELAASEYQPLVSAEYKLRIYTNEEVEAIREVLAKVDERLFLWASAIVSSRSVPVLQRRVNKDRTDWRPTAAPLPFADLFRPTLEDTTANVACAGMKDTNELLCRAWLPIKPGDILRVSLAKPKLTNLMLYTAYGFIPMHNPTDNKIVVQLPSLDADERAALKNLDFEFAVDDPVAGSGVVALPENWTPLLLVFLVKHAHRHPEDPLLTLLKYNKGLTPEHDLETYNGIVEYIQGLRREYAGDSRARRDLTFINQLEQKEKETGVLSMTEWVELNARRLVFLDKLVLEKIESDALEEIDKLEVKRKTEGRRHKDEL